MYAGSQLKTPVILCKKNTWHLKPMKEPKSTASDSILQHVHEHDGHVIVIFFVLFRW